MNFVALQNFNGGNERKIHMISGFILLISHLGLLIAFKTIAVDLFVKINTISVLLYTIAIYLVYINKFISAIIISHIEIVVYAILSVMTFGWGYGFEYYIFGLFSLLYFDARKITKITYFISITEFCIFLGLYFYTKMGYPIIFNSHLPSEITDYKNIILITNLFIVCIFLTIYQHLFNIDSTLRIIELNNQKEYYEKLANYDSLTNILNRQSFTDIVSRRYQKNYPLKSAVLIIDIDNFKHINDRYGHDEGDNVLVKVADLLKKHDVKDTNLISRWGGEEFVVDIYDALSLDELQKYANEILTLISNHNFEGLKEAVSVSIGGCWSKDTNLSFKEYEEMLHQADKNLYECKNSGRGLAKTTQFIRKK